MDSHILSAYINERISYSLKDEFFKTVSQAFLFMICIYIKENNNIISESDFVEKVYNYLISNTFDYEKLLTIDWEIIENIDTNESLVYAKGFIHNELVTEKNNILYIFNAINLVETGITDVSLKDLISYVENCEKIRKGFDDIHIINKMFSNNPTKENKEILENFLLSIKESFKEIKPYCKIINSNAVEDLIIDRGKFLLSKFK